MRTSRHDQTLNPTVIRDQPHGTPVKTVQCHISNCRPIWDYPPPRYFLYALKSLAGDSVHVSRQRELGDTHIDVNMLQSDAHLPLGPSLAGTSSQFWPGEKTLKFPLTASNNYTGTLYFNLEVKHRAKRGTRRESCLCPPCLLSSSRGLGPPCEAEMRLRSPSETEKN